MTKQRKRILQEGSPVNELLGKLSNPATEETPEQPRPPKIEAKAPKGYKLDPHYIEKKTARLQLVLKPTTANELKRFCKGQGVSVNDYVGGLIERALDTQAKRDEGFKTQLISDEYKQARKGK